MTQSLDKPKITLYCLPFAGGSALSYRDFNNHVAEFIDLKLIDLPGRGRRIKEPLLTNIEAVVDDILDQIKNEIGTKPYAIYGHSMGTLLGYLLTRRLLNLNLPAPAHWFFSGRKAPSIVDNDPPKYKLPKPEFIEMLNQLGGAPPEILAHAELMEFFEPILRADFEAVETYVHVPTSPLNIPLTILYGSNDKETPYAKLLPWQQETGQPISVKEFAGGHFFIFDYLPQLGQLFSETLGRKLRS